ncbi:hypothetical protein AB4Z25_11845 [Rhizobium sp. RAF36]|uniref:hypothetical protein n=1 Tax=Rhizobium sp. RAF36 TaxID=3233055 RepID=UPI003F9CA517
MTIGVRTDDDKTMQIFNRGRASRPLRLPAIFLNTISVASRAAVNIAALRPILAPVAGSGLRKWIPLYIVPTTLLASRMVV